MLAMVIVIPTAFAFAIRGSYRKASLRAQRMAEESEI